MHLLVAQDWSPTTWALLFVGMVVAILAVFVTFVMVLVRAARPTPPPGARPDLVGHAGEGGGTTDAHHHPHAA
jgi:hypothetical protein